ncbi:hypothetical protein DAPPUDRAFT_112291 [Daphnia pulex]|uniref:Uncharacterized protein n=1 Tax=Daphnia pulex TaxID=6669 RepID=E9HBK0_DAPPU|nr:hypothetical protein DAPPUDRAFT_112291 [Daphnia pulex]|eukprot:EFX70854.1 hypothetical protein DAPPUDRAFT_112291 [Daphnia pulex]
MASKETNQLRENELQALHHSIEQLNSGNSEVSFQNDSLENQKTSKRKRANQADVQTQTPKKSKRRNVNITEENLSDPNNPLDEILEVDAEESGADLTVQLTKKDVVELLFEEDFSSSDEETTKPSNDIPRVQQPTENILQTAISEIIVQLEPSSPEICKTLGTPTGIVQPLVVNHEAQDMPFTISFPTMDLPQIEMFHNPCSSLSEVSSLQSSTVELSPEATLLLNEQLRKHVQLLTQMHLITAQQAGLENVTEKCRFMLQDLVPLKQRVDIANLDEAIRLVTHWETVVTKVPPEKLKKFQRTVVVCSGKKKYLNRTNIYPERYPFNSEMVELMAESRVFIYPELLPKLAIFESESGLCKMSSHEEQLIAMGMEQFTPFYNHLDKKSASKEVNSMISKFMLPHRTAKQIETRITNKSLERSKEEGNPIKVRFFFWFMNEVVIVLWFSSGKKYYLANEVAPPIHHSIQPFDRYSTTTLCDVPPNLLPERWQKEMLIHGGMLRQSRKNSRGHPPEKTKKKKLDSVMTSHVSSYTSCSPMALRSVCYPARRIYYSPVHSQLLYCTGHPSTNSLTSVNTFIQSVNILTWRSCFLNEPNGVS